MLQIKAKYISLFGLALIPNLSTAPTTQAADEKWVCPLKYLV